MPATVDADTCAGCGACVLVCPKKAIRIEVVARVDAQLCVSCNLCAEACPEFAIKVSTS